MNPRLPTRKPTSTDLAIADQRVEARQKGYVGESSADCGNFAIVRNGARLECEACRSVTGCF
jgi:ribonucleoside-diphosphate reductase alpha chain